MAVFPGTPDADNYSGTPDDDQITGGAGNDTLSGAGGNDTIDGDQGDDTLEGGAGNDTLNGGIGNDTLIGDGQGEAGYANTINGGDGNDYIESRGADAINGGSGDDTVVVTESAAPTSLQGGTGTDLFYLVGVEITIENFTASNGFEVFHNYNEAFSISGTEASNVIDLGHLAMLDAGTLGAGISGLGGDDVLTGTSRGDRLSGGSGADVLSGGGGIDSLIGGEGNDTIYGGAEYDAIAGGEGDDSLQGEGDDALEGNAGTNTLTGGEGNDRLYSEGSDTIDGGVGDDAVFLNSNGPVSLSGGVGSDLLIVTGGVTLTGFSSANEFEQLRVEASFFSIAGTEVNNVIDFSGLTLEEGSFGLSFYGREGDDVISGLDVLDGLFGEAGDDILNGGGGDDYLNGGDDNDALNGGAGNDELHGSVGNDTLKGDDGVDKLYAEGGSDRLEGGAGDDLLFGVGSVTTDTLTLLGQDGNDFIQTSGTVTIDGGVGDDAVVLNGGTAVLSVQGGAGSDLFWLDGGVLLDSFSAANGFETYRNWGRYDVTGGEGVNVYDFSHLALIVEDPGTPVTTGIQVDALGGADTVTGTVLGDLIRGGDGDDFLRGAAGDDELQGGEGVDVARYTGAQTDYSVEDLGDGAMRVTDLRAGGPDGVDILRDVETIVFNYNPAAAVDGVTSSITYLENAAPQIIDSDVSFSEEGALGGATLRVSGLIATDRVSVRNQGTGAGQVGFSGGVVSYGGTAIGTATGGSGATLVVTLNASATNAAVEALIENLTFASISNIPPASHNLTVQFTDAGGATDSDVVTVNITPVNDAPGGTNGSAGLAPGAARTFAATDFGFTDIDGHSLIGVRIVTLPSAGTLTLNGAAVSAGTFVTTTALAAGQLVFTAAANASGTTYGAFTFQVLDSGGTANGGSNADLSANSFSFSIAVTPNLAPAGTDGSISMDANSQRVLAAAEFGFTDSNGDSLAAVRIASLPAAGALTLNGTGVTVGQLVSIAAINAGQLVFTASVGASGPNYASFTFQVQDDGGTAGGGVDTDQSPNTLTIDVTAVNRAPAGTDGSATLLEDGSKIFSAADFGFTDPDGDALAGVRISTLPVAGALRLDGVLVTAGQTISAADLAAGKLVFTPAPNANGTGYAGFAFQVQDDGGTASGGVNLDASANAFTLNVTAVNDAPSGTNRTLTLLEDGSRALATADFGFSDVEGNAFAGVLVSSLPAAGALTLNGVAVTAGQFVSIGNISSGQLVFTPAANANGAGAASFGFQVRDNGGVSNGGVNTDVTPNTVTFDVTPVNDAPSGGGRVLTLLEDAPRVFLTADFGFTDADGDAFAGVRISSLPTAGALTLNGVAVTAGQVVSAAGIAGGGLVFAPAPNASGTSYATFSFQVQDNGGTANGGQDIDASPNAFTLRVTPVNDAPSGANRAVTMLEDGSRALATADFGFTDPEGNAFAGVVVSSLPAAGSLRLNGVAVTAGQFVSVGDISTGRLVFSPAANGNGTGYASFGFQVRDNGGTSNGGVNTDPTPNIVTFNVTPVNDAPILTGGVPAETSIESDGVAAGLHTTTASALIISDVDVGDTAGFDLTGWTQVGSTASYTRVGTFGVATLNTQTGVVGYALDNGDVDTQALNSGDTGSDAFTLTVRDAADAIGARTVTFQVQGANERVVGTVDDDVLNGGRYGDAVEGGEGDDLLNGLSGHDAVLGEGGDDTLYGGSGGDTLDGGADADMLSSGSGNDVLRGGSGRDQATGGSGADRFVFDDADFASATRTGSDLITDLVRADGDCIDLSLVDAITSSGLDDGFAFIGTNAFSNQAGQLRYEVIGSTTFVLGDQTGDGVADFAIRLTNVYELAASDFIL